MLIIQGAWFDVYAKAVKIHVEFYSFLYIIEVDVSLLRNYKGMGNTAKR